MLLLKITKQDNKRPALLYKFNPLAKVLNA